MSKLPDTLSATIRSGIADMHKAIARPDIILDLDHCLERPPGDKGKYRAGLGGCMMLETMGLDPSILEAGTYISPDYFADSECTEEKLKALKWAARGRVSWAVGMFYGEVPEGLKRVLSALRRDMPGATQRHHKRFTKAMLEMADDLEELGL